LRTGSSSFAPLLETLGCDPGAERFVAQALEQLRSEAGRGRAAFWWWHWRAPPRRVVGRRVDAGTNDADRGSRATCRARFRHWRLPRAQGWVARRHGRRPGRVLVWREDTGPATGLNGC